jgi:hypothetical protein
LFQGGDVDAVLACPGAEVAAAEIPTVTSLLRNPLVFVLVRAPIAVAAARIFIWYWYHRPLIPLLFQGGDVDAVLACPGAEVAAAEITAVTGLLRNPLVFVLVRAPIAVAGARASERQRQGIPLRPDRGDPADIRLDAGRTHGLPDDREDRVDIWLDAGLYDLWFCTWREGTRPVNIRQSVRRSLLFRGCTRDILLKLLSRVG